MKNDLSFFKNKIGILFITILTMLFLQCKTQKRQQISFKADVMYRSLATVNMQERIFDRLLNKPKRGSNHFSSKKFNKKLETTERWIDGFLMLTVQNSKAINKHIVFFHGGGYTMEALKQHRKLVEDLALLYNFKVSYLDYPLFPEYSAIQTHKMVKKAYQQLTESYTNDNFYFLGDSAGGGLALALVQILRDQKSSYLPKKTVLLSPWLDVTLSNPEIENYIQKDVILHREGLKEMGRRYAKEINLKSPEISPIYASMHNLSDLLVFVSSHEIFYPDCKLLKEKADNAQGTSCKLIVKDKMIHDWMILPIRERNESLEKMVSFLKEN